MSTLTLILLIVSAIIVVILIAALFTGKEYIVDREIIINRKKEDIFNYIKFSMNQNDYNKWWMMDPNARKEYMGTDGTPGFTMKWESDSRQAGAGEQEITKITAGERVDYEIRFKKPFEGTAYSYITTTGLLNDATNVVWEFKGERNYGMRIFHLVFNLKKMLGKDIMVSLENLKTIVESK